MAQAAHHPDLFEGDYPHRIIDEGPPRTRRAGRWYLGAIYAGVFALFAVVVWQAFSHGGASGTPPFIRAAEGDYKRPASPAERGGLPVVNEGAAIVTQRGLADAAPRREQILPRPAPPARAPLEADPTLAEPPLVTAAIESAPEPAAPATVAQQQTDRPAAPSPLGALALPESSGPDSSSAAGAAPAPIDTPGAPTLAPPLEQPTDDPTPPALAGLVLEDGLLAEAVPPTAPDIAPPLARPALAAPRSAPAAATQPRAAQPTVVAAAPPTRLTDIGAHGTAPGSARGAALGGPWRIQIAALASEDSVRAAWRSLQQRHPQILGRLTLAVEPTTAGATRLYRMQAAGFSDRDSAAQLCRQLQAAGTDCFVVGRSS